MNKVELAASIIFIGAGSIGALLIAGAIIALGVFFLSGPPSEEDAYGKRAFDREAWLRNDAEKDGSELCPRGGMVRDLQRKHLTRGARKSEVIALLGSPRPPADGRCVSYTLGLCSGYQIDYDSLVICFDAGDRLTTSWNVQH